MSTELSPGARPPEISPVDAYRAQTDRLSKLADFVGRLAPAYGESCPESDSINPRQSVDDVTPPNILASRDEAMKAALDAIRDIALASWRPPL